MSDSHVCPFCDRGYRMNEDKLYDGIFVYTYTCGTKLNMTKDGNRWTYKWEPCSYKLKDLS